MNYHRWSKSEITFLIKKYEWIGDTKLAEMFNLKFPKSVHTWTKKHIEKKRNYLGLKRSAEQERYLRCENNKDGRQVRMWDTRGRLQEGEIRTWKGRQFTKKDGVVIAYNRFLMDAKPGEVVRKVSGELKIITRAENAAYNSKMRTNYPTELKEAIQALNQLIKITNGKENSRS
jgi:hypothetical protein